jgi:hypothetical protein
MSGQPPSAGPREASAGISLAVHAVVAGTVSVEEQKQALPAQGEQKPPRRVGKSRFLGLAVAAPGVAGKVETPGVG